MSVIQNADWATIIETVVCFILIVAIVIEYRRLSSTTGAATSIGGCEVLGGGRGKVVYVRIEFGKAERTEACRVS